MMSNQVNKGRKNLLGRRNCVNKGTEVWLGKCWELVAR